MQNRRLKHSGLSSPLANPALKDDSDAPLSARAPISNIRSSISRRATYSAGSRDFVQHRSVGNRGANSEYESADTSNHKESNYFSDEWRENEYLRSAQSAPFVGRTRQVEQGNGFHRTLDGSRPTSGVFACGSDGDAADDMNEEDEDDGVNMGMNYAECRLSSHPKHRDHYCSASVVLRSSREGNGAANVGEFDTTQGLVVLPPPALSLPTLASKSGGVAQQDGASRARRQQRQQFHLDRSGHASSLQDSVQEDQKVKDEEQEKEREVETHETKVHAHGRNKPRSRGNSHPNDNRHGSLHEHHARRTHHANPHKRVNDAHQDGNSAAYSGAVSHVESKCTARPTVTEAASSGKGVDSMHVKEGESAALIGHGNSANKNNEINNINNNNNSDDTDNNCKRATLYRTSNGCNYSIVPAGATATAALLYPSPHVVADALPPHARHDELMAMPQSSPPHAELVASAGGAAGAVPVLAPAVTPPAPQFAQTKVQIGVQLKHWVIINRIGAGSFGETFTGVEVDWPPPQDDPLSVSPLASALLRTLPPPSERSEVCIKVEQENKNVLRLETLVLKRVQSCAQVVRYYGSGCLCGMNFLVMEKLGPNLADLRRRNPHGTFNIYTTLRAGVSCLQAIRGVHEQGLVHRDIKPSNFVIGLPGTEEQTTCFLIDFGLARRFRRSGGEIRPPRANAGFRGTSRYASVGSHHHAELGRVDDLWSLLFMLVEFATGTLPWRKYKDKEAIGRCKEESTGPYLVRHLPREFQPFLAHLVTLTYEDEPDYDLLLSLMHRAIKRRNYLPNKPLDWELEAHMLETIARAEHEQQQQQPDQQQAPLMEDTKPEMTPQPHVRNSECVCTAHPAHDAKHELAYAGAAAVAAAAAMTCHRVHPHAPPLHSPTMALKKEAHAGGASDSKEMPHKSDGLGHRHGSDHGPHDRGHTSGVVAVQDRSAIDLVEENDTHHLNLVSLCAPPISTAHERQNDMRVVRVEGGGVGRVVTHGNRTNESSESRRAARADAMAVTLGGGRGDEDEAMMQPNYISSTIEDGRDDTVNHTFACAVNVQEHQQPSSSLDGANLSLQVPPQLQIDDVARPRAAEPARDNPAPVVEASVVVERNAFSIFSPREAGVASSGSATPHAVKGADGKPQDDSRAARLDSRVPTMQISYDRHGGKDLIDAFTQEVNKSGSIAAGHGMNSTAPACIADPLAALPCMPNQVIANDGDRASNNLSCVPAAAAAHEAKGGFTVDSLRGRQHRRDSSDVSSNRVINERVKCHCGCTNM